MSDKIEMEPEGQADNILNAPLVGHSRSVSRQAVSDFINTTLVQDPSAQRQVGEPSKSTEEPKKAEEPVGPLFSAIVWIVIAVVLVFAGIGFKELFLTNHKRDAQQIVTTPRNGEPDSYREHQSDAPVVSEKAVQTTGEPSNVELIVMAKDAVKLRLKDPDTAKFKGVFVSNKSGNRIVCGSVNAKNGMGGYNGYEGFVSNGLPQATFMASEISDFSNAWTQFCSR